MCCCGLNQISTLPANIADKSDGSAVDVSGLQAKKTIEISGSYSGSYSVLGSHDGLLYFPVATFDSGSGVQTIRRTLEVTARFMKVRREAAQSGLVTVKIAAKATVDCASSGQSGANNFFTLATLRSGAKGPQAPLDLFASVASTGVDVSSIACSGAFQGVISVEGSLDGTNYSPLTGFTSSQSQRGLNPTQSMFDPVVVTEICRFVRVNVLPGTIVTGPTSFTIGGPQNCDCASPPPPASADDLTITEFGNYATPQVIGGPAVAFEVKAQGQFWYDFSLIPEANLNIFLGLQAAITFANDPGGHGCVMTFGAFILPDGDVTVSDLFSTIIPDVQCSFIFPGTATLGVFKGIDGTAVIPNPGVGRQVLLASLISFVGSGAGVQTGAFRSLLFDVMGVSP